MDRALLDTDVLSEILKGVNANLATRAAAYRASFGYYTLSLITGNTAHYQRIQGLGYPLKLDNWKE